jgi:hypothetical protein
MNSSSSQNVGNANHIKTPTANNNNIVHVASPSCYDLPNAKFIAVYNTIEPLKPHSSSSSHNNLHHHQHQQQGFSSSLNNNNNNNNNIQINNQNPWSCYNCFVELRQRNFTGPSERFFAATTSKAAVATPSASDSYFVAHGPRCSRCGSKKEQSAIRVFVGQLTHEGSTDIVRAMIDELVVHPARHLFDDGSRKKSTAPSVSASSSIASIYPSNNFVVDQDGSGEIPSQQHQQQIRYHPSLSSNSERFKSIDELVLHIEPHTKPVGPENNNCDPKNNHKEIGNICTTKCKIGLGCCWIYVFYPYQLCKIVYALNRKTFVTIRAAGTPCCENCFCVGQNENNNNINNAQPSFRPCLCAERKSNNNNNNFGEKSLTASSNSVSASASEISLTSSSSSPFSLPFNPRRPLVGFYKFLPDEDKSDIEMIFQKDRQSVPKALQYLLYRSTVVAEVPKHLEKLADAAQEAFEKYKAHIQLQLQQLQDQKPPELISTTTKTTTAQESVNGQQQQQQQQQGSVVPFKCSLCDDFTSFGPPLRIVSFHSPPYFCCSSKANAFRWNPYGKKCSAMKIFVQKSTTSLPSGSSRNKSVTTTMSNASDSRELSRDVETISERRGGEHEFEEEEEEEEQKR